eukprot:TRINITY_DN2413_c0_g1_i1.p1 TRINITY_DN2413_c0_g1~~TRINITY_DN2413_c0_g1_i1.p1  ORF type:complete len:347 (+),score=86.56 TRINITY_DN2413_c0_g1_i1:127-1167(+)
MSRTAIIEAYNFASPQDAARIVEKPKPVPKENEVLVNITLRPVDPADVFSLMGFYPGFQPKTLPATPGLEGMGVVAEIGKSVKRKFSVGQRVVPLLFNNYVQQGNGSYQEFVAVHEDHLVAVPDEISDEDAAHIVVNPVTVWGMLDRLKIPKGKFLIQNAAGSTLGRQLIQVCKSIGINTINLVRREEQAAELENEYKESKGDGVVRVFWSEDKDLQLKIKDATNGELAYAGVDAVAGKESTKMAQNVRNHGEVLVYGAMNGLEATISVIDLLFRMVNYTGYWVTPVFMAKSAEEQHKIVNQCFEWYLTGIIKSGHGTILPFSKLKEGVEETNKPKRGGKILLRND